MAFVINEKSILYNLTGEEYYEEVWKFECSNDAM